MSFATCARHVRDQDLPYGRRYSSLRCAVGHYCPLGFDSTWSYLSTAGALRTDERALLLALDMLELSRAAWLAELGAFADRRRTAKRQQQRAPSVAELRRLNGWRWPGPDGHRAMFREIGLLWAVHAAEPFPEVPTADKGDLAYLDATVSGCLSTYLARGGALGPGHEEVLRSCLPKLRRGLVHLGHPATFPGAFAYFRRLLKLAELAVHDDSRDIPERHGAVSAGNGHSRA
ncbi:hypothetical protein ACIPYS_27575 [Kitasatospora sp. NPDC089913]|uniref:hypothetical protein n=1 Tax=Streptomycetaceae TaxID=2062 RepID=UPI00087C04E8|nr:hypothetical protein [Streptomyces sp. TLI_053]SDT39646.1 hypothetical protein SAMN05216371_2146 [Streptomyces sp. TLI_053]